MAALTIQYRIRVNTRPEMIVPHSESSGFFTCSSLVEGWTPPFQHTRPASNGKLLTARINYAGGLEQKRTPLLKVLWPHGKAARADAEKRYSRQV
jgi:hypothetical protein